MARGQYRWKTWLLTATFIRGEKKPQQQQNNTPPQNNKSNQINQTNRKKKIKIMRKVFVKVFEYRQTPVIYTRTSLSKAWIAQHSEVKLADPYNFSELVFSLT